MTSHRRNVFNSRRFEFEHADSAPNFVLPGPHNGHHNGRDRPRLLHKAEQGDQSDEHAQPAEVLLLPFRPGSQQDGRPAGAEHQAQVRLQQKAGRPRAEDPGQVFRPEQLRTELWLVL